STDSARVVTTECLLPIGELRSYGNHSASSDATRPVERHLVSRITVIGGTGYAGSAIVAEAAARGHQVTALSRSIPEAPILGVTYVQGDAADEATLSASLDGADVVVAALAPRGPLAGTFRDVYSTIGRLADAAGVPLFVVGGYSSLRPAPGADRFVTDLSHIPAELHDEIRAGAALIIEDPGHA